MTTPEEYSKLHLENEVAEIQNSGRINEFPQLSVYEKSLIYKYSDDGYKAVNKSLRIHKGKSNTEFGMLLDECLLKLPNYNDWSTGAQT